MANFLANALASDEYSAALDNELTGDGGWRDNYEVDYDSEPPAVTLGEDGNYYANDNRWTPGYGWSTTVGTEPVYYFTMSGERSKVDEDQWEYDEFGNVVTKDTDFAANGKALTPSHGWLTEAEIKQQWESDNNMAIFRKANPDLTFDDFALDVL